MDIDAYLDRIGVPVPTTAGTAALRVLHRAHLTAVPFENLSIHLGERISLDAGALFDKIVRDRRGGFCYELNGLFALLLEELGYRVRRVAARVDGGGRLGPSFDHLALLVDTVDGDGPWLADVGFGSHSMYPLDFAGRVEQPDPEGRFRVRTLIRSAGDTRTEVALDTDDALLAAYRDHFGIMLDRAPAVPVSG